MRFILLLLPYLLFAQDLRFGKDETQILIIRKKSQVNIVTYEGDNEIQAGHGFFISKDGKILTNHHVVKDFDLKNPNHKIQITDWSGKLIKDLKVIKCLGPKNADLCLLSSSFKAPGWYEVENKNISIGNEIHFFGECNGVRKFKKGKIISFANDFIRGQEINFENFYDKNVERMEISMELCHGDSGSAIYNPSNGEIQGIATSIFIDSKKVTAKKNLAISTKAIFEWLNDSFSYQSFDISNDRIKPIKGANLDDLFK